MSVMELANAGIENDVYERGHAAPHERIIRGERLPTRINHRMIALRELELVTHQRSGGRVLYGLTAQGQALASAVQKIYSGRGQVPLCPKLRAAWRPVLVNSAYVRSQWLKYFTSTDDFSYADLLRSSNSLTITRLPISERVFSEGQTEDSGYRFISRSWDVRKLDDLERREVYEGLRRWTDQAYLTDYRLPPAFESPFLYQSDPDLGLRFELEWYIANAWLDPGKEVEAFAQKIKDVLLTWGVKSSPIPDLVIHLSKSEGYTKKNIVEMLTALYYQSNQFFFQRGSEFLIKRAFEDVKSEDYYVQIEGTWRTGIMLR